MKHFNKILFFFGLLFFIAACKPKQHIVYTTSPVEDKENSQLFSDILSNEFGYSTFASKLNLNISTGTRSVSSRANLRIDRDKALQISLQPMFGVEMFRLYMDNETLIFLDRMNKRYVKESLEELKKTYPVGFDYNTLQALLTNGLFVSGNTAIEKSDYKKFRYSQTSNNYNLKSADGKSGIEYNFTVNAADRITFTHLTEPVKKYSLQWGYTDFMMVKEKTFPSKMNISAGTSSRNLDVTMSFSDIVLNEPVDIQVKIPSGYSRTSLSDIIKIISAN